MVFVVVTAFPELKSFFFPSSCRQQLLKVTFESPPISPKSPASAVKCKTPREKGQTCKGSFLSNYFQKKPKTSPGKDARSHSSVTQSTGEKDTGHSRRSNEDDLHSSSKLLVVKEEPTDAEEENLHLLKTVKQEDTAWQSHTSAPEVAHSSSPTNDIKPIIKGETLPSLGQSDMVTQCDAFWVTSLLKPAGSNLSLTCPLSHPTCRKQVLYHSKSINPKTSHSKSINLIYEALMKSLRWHLSVFAFMCRLQWSAPCVP